MFSLPFHTIYYNWQPMYGSWSLKMDLIAWVNAWLRKFRSYGCGKRAFKKLYWHAWIVPYAFVPLDIWWYVEYFPSISLACISRVIWFMSFVAIKFLSLPLSFIVIVIGKMYCYAIVRCNNVKLSSSIIPYPRFPAEVKTQAHAAKANSIVRFFSNSDITETF